MTFHVLPEVDDAARIRSIDQEKIAAAIALPLEAIERADGVRVAAPDHLGLGKANHQIGHHFGPSRRNVRPLAL